MVEERKIEREEREEEEEDKGREKGIGEKELGFNF